MKQLLSIICMLLTASCTWVQDDTDDCPYGFWLGLHYTYNILDVEAAPEYVNEATVFVYDAEGSYITRIDADRATLKANGYRVRVQGLPEGDYQFVVWSGIAQNQYAVWGTAQEMSQFRLSLPGQVQASSARLASLYYGRLQTVHYSDAYAVHDVFLTKDTNELTCIVVATTKEAAATLGNYTLCVRTANGTMDASNLPASEDVVTYHPFVKEGVTINDGDYGELHGIKYSISTLRLMEDVGCRLILTEDSTGEDIFSLSLPEHIGMIGSLYTKNGKPLTVQEYLDRQDLYTIVVFLSDDLKQLLQIQVNSWRLRAINRLKL